jgi:hypothetical protein
VTTPQPTGSGRETRLLLLVIVVAVAVLLVLARFRFPAADRAAVSPTPGPIERLAARATFADLSLIIADVSAKVEPSLVSIAIERVPPMTRASARAQTPAAPIDRHFVAGLRIAADLALITLPDGFRVAVAEGITVELLDPPRGLALVRVPESANPGAGLTAPSSSTGVPGYIVVGEGGRVGAALRPVFVGRLDPVPDDRWSQPPLAVGGAPPMAAGQFVFSLDGRLIGATIQDSQGVVIVRASALESAVAALLMGGRGAGTPGGVPQG